MRFALIGEHPDGLDMARALVDSGRHELLVFCGALPEFERLQRWGVSPRRTGDMEDALADPQVEAVIVAGNMGDRPAQLRRALQSEQHVLCVHPADYTPDTAYEAAMIRRDTGKLLVPLLPEAFHPGLVRLIELAAVERSSLLVEIEFHATEQVLLEADDVSGRGAFPCWQILRALGGDIGEVMVFAETDHLTSDQAMLVSGRFVNGGLFREKLLPNDAESRLQITLATRTNDYELTFPLGIPGPAELAWQENGERRTECWPEWNPWPTLVEAFEGRLRTRSGEPAPGASGGRKLSWEDEVRALELDAAARRSLEHRRAASLDFQEVTEEASFKGTMTLLGCGLLWISLVLLIFSIWLPWLGWAIAPLFGLFLLLQTLNWIVPKEQKPGESEAMPPAKSADPE